MFYSTQGSAQPQETRRELFIGEFPTIFPVQIFLVFVCSFLQFYFEFHVESWLRLVVLKVEPTAFALGFPRSS